MRRRGARGAGVDGAAFSSKSSASFSAARYAAQNPVRARLVEQAQDWRRSSVRAHLAGRDDELATVAPLLDRCAKGFADLIETPPSPRTLSALRAAETIGRPLGASDFMERVAALLGGPRPPHESQRGAGKRDP